ncbi:Beta-1 [Nibea albiflora]|uniref:Beta-1 n=1 Tax=Nibea albiflora TaxID=240163 RepID=A0ACB7EH10_NIBAL|nr:Beta-1 [Nibea albiflora]
MGGLRLEESGKWCGSSRQRCLFIILVLATVLFFYNTNVTRMVPDWTPKWWQKYDASKLWIALRRGQNVVPPETEATPGPAPAATNIKNITSATETTKIFHQPVLETPVPYESPGPYLVEYPYKYHFVINEPNRCEQEKPFLVLIVPVAPNNRAHRDFIRITWGGESPVLDKAVKLFFLLGRHNSEGVAELQEQLLLESRDHRDLIQSDFLDCYKNLTIKTMVMMEWLDKFCSQATYGMKIDSDMFLNVPNLIRILLKAPKTNYMTGCVAAEGPVVRDKSSKWYIPEELYPDPFYPRYALGLGYVFSLDLPKKLVEASRHVKAVYIEDVYLGWCMKHLGIPPTNPPDWGYFHVVPVPYSRCAYFNIIATTTKKDQDRMADWTDFKRPGPHC